MLPFELLAERERYEVSLARGVTPSKSLYDVKAELGLCPFSVFWSPDREVVYTSRLNRGELARFRKYGYRLRVSRN
jgi:hypothetical protein